MLVCLRLLHKNSLLSIFLCFYNKKTCSGISSLLPEENTKLLLFIYAFRKWNIGTNATIWTGLTFVPGLYFELHIARIKSKIHMTSNDRDTSVLLIPFAKAIALSS